MQKLSTFFVIGLSALWLTGCQTTAKEFNGQSGFQIINKTESTATLSYALAGNTRNDLTKLQSACQQVLGSNKQYKVQVTSTSEIANVADAPEFGRQIGQSNTKFGLSNTPDLYTNNSTATNAGLEARPSTLRLFRFNCS